MNTAMSVARSRAEVPVNIEEPGPEGDAVRERLGRAMVELHTPQFCCGGLNFGYFYDRSPIIAHDGETAPPYTMYDFTPSTVPGCRAPHVWLRDGRSLYDAIGTDFTLLRFDRSVPVDAMAGAAAKRGVPLSVLDVDLDGASSPYTHKLVLSRPDQHVAWRGNAQPDDPLALIDLIRGGAPPAAKRSGGSVRRNGGGTPRSSRSPGP